MARNRKYQKRHRVTVEGFTPTANPAQAAAAREMARSSATQRHDSRPHRQRTRATQRRHAMREYI